MVLKRPIASSSGLSCLRHVAPRQPAPFMTRSASALHPIRARRYPTQNAHLERHKDPRPTLLVHSRAPTPALELRAARFYRVTSPVRHASTTNPPTQFASASALPTSPEDPISSNPHFSSPKTNEEHPDAIPDNEWELRTGRAIYVLQTTLPTFFETGLVTRVDVSTGEPVPPSQHSHFHIPILDSATPLDFLSSSAGDKGANGKGGNGNSGQVDDAEDIYSPNVRLQYTPPVALPAPFPKTFHLEGFHLYIASSSLVRRTMMALYTDLEVTLTKMKVFTEPPPPSSDSDFGGGGGYTNASTASTSAVASSLPLDSSSSSPFSSVSRPLSLNPLAGNPQPNLGSGTVLGTEAKDEGEKERRSGKEKNETKRRGSKKRRVGREKYVRVRQVVTGVNRVSGKVGEWEVESTYTFSPATGLILHHTVNSIQPTPHLAVYDLLRGSLGQVFGFGGGGRIGGEGVGGVRM